MAKVVELTVPAEGFALTETFESVQGAVFEALPIAAHPPTGSMSFFSAKSSVPERLEDAVQSDRTTDSAVTLARSSDRQLYQISWHPQVRSILGLFLQTTGSLLHAVGKSGTWNLCFLFPDQDSVSEICESWQNHGIDLSIRRVVGVARKLGVAEMELSQCQHDTLLRAYQMDYYEVPRGASLECVAEDLQVSHQALSERLRRGHKNLIETTICDSTTPLPTVI